MHAKGMAACWKHGFVQVEDSIATIEIIETVSAAVGHALASACFGTGSRRSYMDFSLYKDPTIVLYVLIIPVLVIGIVKMVQKIKNKQAQ